MLGLIAEGPGAEGSRTALPAPTQVAVSEKLHPSRDARLPVGAKREETTPREIMAEITGLRRRAVLDKNLSHPLSVEPRGIKWSSSPFSFFFLPANFLTNDLIPRIPRCNDYFGFNLHFPIYRSGITSILDCRPVRELSKRFNNWHPFFSPPENPIRRTDRSGSKVLVNRDASIGKCAEGTVK